ncbi:MAG: alpha/beta hydrolase [Planctomycetota bacterium]
MKFDSQGWYLERGRWGELAGILIAPRGVTPSAMVTLCHGFGASGTDLVPLTEEIVPELPDGLIPPAFYFPEGPFDLEAIYGMPGACAWWPINMEMLAELAAADAFAVLEDQIPEGIDSARTKLVESISQCAAAHEWGSIAHVLGGFSQGAMLTIDTALRGDGLAVQGAIAWSGALICQKVWHQSHRNRPVAIPAYHSHGRQDPILPISAGRALNRFLNGLGWDVESFEFDGPHTIPLEGISGAARLIERVVQSGS